MLAPRFTLRTGLIALTAAAFVAVVFRSAQAGESWAVGVAVALVAVVLSITLQAVAFVVSLALGGRGER
ncbi:hypothetical protein MalM25_15000 [Planctomycetes bacterium MalM25]|nr:hypothetical protein MalM25_15000 [Planctomycetes bacterium MalM25]